MHRVLALFGGGVLAALLAAAPAQAAGSAKAPLAKVPADMSAKIASMGPVLTLDMIKNTIALFAPYNNSVPLTGIKVTRDVHYGPDPLQKIDLYQPERHKGMPILIFVHGGAYVAGDKTDTSNVTAYFARHGILAINIDYRLAPKAPWPAGAEDVGKVVAWAREHGRSYGGNPHRIFIMGHSAGATHVAMYLFDPALHPRSGAGVVGAILLSGQYQAPTKNPPPNVTAYYGPDVAKYKERSPGTYVDDSKVPLFLGTAEYDPVFLAVPTYELAATVCRRDGKCPRFAWQKGQNHISEAAAFDTTYDVVGSQIVNFIWTTH